MPEFEVGDYCIQVVGLEEIVVVHRSHPLMKMTENEFASSVEDPIYEAMAGALYERRIRIPNV